MRNRCLRLRLVVVTLLICILAAGCSSSNANQTDNGFEDSGSESNDSNNNSTDGNSENNDAEESSTTLASSSGYEQLTTADFDYVMATDDQPDYGHVFTENGYYYLEYLDEFGSELLLMFHDDASGADVVVCSKANCSHRDEGCDAYFDYETHPYLDLYYCEGNLYIFCIDEDYDAVERISADGTVREISCRLYRSVSVTEELDDDWVSTRNYRAEITIHRGYAFFSTYYPGCEECGLYCVKLDSDEEATEICTIEAENPWLYRLKGYGAYLFFQMGTYQEEDDYYDIDIYAYNIETGEVNLCVEDAIRDYTAGGECVYYCDLTDSVYCYNVTTGETIQVIDSGGTRADMEVYMFVKDGNFYYTDPAGGKQDVYDSEGNLVETRAEGDFVIPYVSDESK